MSSNWKKKTRSDSEFRLIGCVGKPHGLHGDFFLHLESEISTWLTDLKCFWVKLDDSWQEWAVVRWRKKKERPTLKFQELVDRTAVELHARLPIYVLDEDARAGLIPVDNSEKTSDSSESDSDEFYFHSDMEGLKVFRVGDIQDLVGHIVAVHELPAYNQLEIRKANGRTFLLPFVKQLVPDVDIEGSFILANIPEGLEDIDEN